MDFFRTLEEDDPQHGTERRERRRERAFYEYYEPICSLSPVVPSHVNLYDKLAAARHVPRSSPDRALTAFCQLGALRLEARRCLLFFFDTEYAYVLAESTRTLSLVDDNLHAEDDALWLGNVIIPRGISVCEHTVNIPEANHGSNKHDSNAGQIHIINNLTTDTRFCDRPFVTEGPRARFYAGVPITTPSGLRIGAYCVLDDKPRDGLSDKDVDFLIEMGQTIMEHIETIRSRAEFRRGSQMLGCMESFFSSAPVMAAATRKVSLLPDDASHGSGVVEKNELPANYFNKPVTKENPTAVETSPRIEGDTVRASTSVTPVADELDVALESNIKTTFETAATLIRSAADVDGITFVKMADKARRTKHGAARLTHGRDSDVDTAQSNTENTSTDGIPTTDTDKDERAASRDRVCPVLGSSLHEQRHFEAPHVDMIPAKLLRSLLRRYPLGKIWYFDSEGEGSMGESCSDNTDSSTHDSTLHPSAIRQRRSRAKESKDIEKLFPGVRALGLVAMYDLGKDRLYAAAITWTYSPVRILTAEGDLGFLRAFSDVIMSNVARLQAKMEDQAKSDFISSISHELRSPLHGILGSIDFLQEQEAADQTIVTQIERCSITLMDVIEHLLEFAKINNLSQSTHGASRGSRVQAWLENSTQMSSRTQSLPKLTEEVADATFYSHCCNLEAKDHGNVAFILDVASEHLEDFKVPVGAWKRLMINITNNALKYTQQGHISVSLKASHRTRRRPVAVLTVTDTGCGMSRDFLEHRLFKAFSQEDSLANGTGLGMSLVAKLVRNMNGKIEVQSTKHVGTTIKISIPMEAKDAIMPREPAPPRHNVRIRLPSASDSSDPIKRNDRTLQHTALERICRFIGAESVESNADVTLLLEADLTSAFASDELKQSVSGRALIVLCTSFASAATLRHSALARALNCFVDFIPQPFGPERVLESLQRCQTGLQARTSTLVDTSADSTSQLSLESSKMSTSIEEFRSSAYNTTLRHKTPDRSPEIKDALSRPFFDTKLQSSSTDDTPLAATTPSAASVTSMATSVQSLLATDGAMDRMTPAPTPRREVVSDRKRVSLLIVDDNRINVRILMTYADRNGHPRITASNGLEAIQAYQAAALPETAGLDEAHNTIPKPDVIFMDINMPICDGFEASRRIRAFEKSNGIKPATIIALTGLGSADAHKQARDVGVDIFLTKPLRPKDLKPLLESIEQGMDETE